MSTPNPFPATSRYAGLPTASIEAQDGREIVYLTRRFVPPPEALALVREHIVQADDRIDNVAAQHLGDPEQFWQVCDANRANDPADLTRVPGRRLRITLPAGVPGVPMI